MPAKIMAVGEAPGSNEDKQGRPFVGAAGRFLDRLLEIAGLSRKDIFITNVVKCRPPGNRDPAEDEITTCTSTFLHAQFQLVRPALTIALGRIAGRVLLGRPVLMTQEHGKLFPCEYAGIKHNLFLTYHPAAALYGARNKEKLIQDFQALKSTVAELK